MNFWTRVSRIILKNRYLILILIAIATTFLVSQMKHMRFSYTEANLLPEDHEVNVQYNQFLDIFGEEGNLILLAIKDSTVFTPTKFNLWNSLAKSFDSLNEVEFTLSIADVKKLKKHILCHTPYLSYHTNTAHWSLILIRKLWKSIMENTTRDIPII